MHVVAPVPLLSYLGINTVLTTHQRTDSSGSDNQLLLAWWNVFELNSKDTHTQQISN